MWKHRQLDRFLLAIKLLKYLSTCLSVCLSSVVHFFIEQCWMMELQADVTAAVANQLVFSFQSLKVVTIRTNVVL